MKFRWDNKYLYWGVTAFCAAAATLLFYFGIFRMQVLISGISKILNILMPVIYGAIIAYLLNPVVKFIEHRVFFSYFDYKEKKLSPKKKKIVRYICVFLSVVFFIWLIYALLMMIVPELINSIVTIIYNFPSYVNVVEEWIDHILENKDISYVVNNFINNYSQRAQSFLTNDLLPQLQNTIRQVSAGVIDVLLFLKNAVIGIIISVYILADKEVFIGKSKKLLYSIFPIKKSNRIISNFRFIHKTFGGFISGKILDSFIIGVLCYIVTSILKTPYSVLVSVIVGITNIIPFFGPYLGAIPSAFLILLVSPIQCLYFVIFILILQQIDGNIIGPKILGESTGLSSFMVIVAILIGGGLMGVFGMFVGVPVCAVICAILWQSCEKSLKRKDLPEGVEEFESIDYINPDTREVVRLKESEHLQYQKDTNDDYSENTSDSSDESSIDTEENDPK